MSNRFHNKWHRVSHHTYKDPNIIDAGWDPIASHESPFRGDFVIDGGSIGGSLFSKDLYTIHLYPGNNTVDWHGDTITAYSNFVVTGNETVDGNVNVSGNENVKGNISGHGYIKTDSYLYAVGNITGDSNLYITGDAFIQGNTSGRGYIKTASYGDFGSYVATHGSNNNGYGLVVDKKAYVNGETVLNDKTYVNKNGLFVTGNSKFKDDLTIDHQITVKGANNNFISGNVRVGKSISAHDYIKTDTDVSARDIYATNDVYVGNDLDVNNTLTAYDIVVKHHLSAVSATIHHVDITASEGRGFVVTGYAPGEEIPSDYFEIPSQPVVSGVKNIYLDKVGLYVDGWAMFKGETEFERQLILQTDGKVDVGSSFSGGVKTTVYRTDTIVNYPAGGGEYEFHYPNESGILALIENIASDFDDQATYAIGQLVVYNRKLYRCIATHSGPWNDAHFEETTVEFSMPWVIGEGDDSVVQKQSTADPIVGLTVGNRAISQSSISEGMGSFAGLKGYRYTNTGSVTNSLTFEVVPEGWAIGDVVSVVNDSKYPDCATIASISETTVTFTENLPFDSIVDESDWDSKIAYISVKPFVGNIDLGYGSYAEGVGSKALNAAAHAEGRETKAFGQYSHTEGRETKAQYCAHAEGRNTEATGNYSHAEGVNTEANFKCSHAEGYLSKSLSDYSHAEGYNTNAGDGTKEGGWCSHAEGNSTVASGQQAHAEGLNTVASGVDSHAEGTLTIASGKASHAEGSGVSTNILEAKGQFSHAEGACTHANGSASHAEGYNTVANGANSHAEGGSTITQNWQEHAEGRFNLSHKQDTVWGRPGNTLHSVGHGTSESDRKNALEIMQDGKVFIVGIGGYDGTNPTGTGVDDVTTALLKFDRDSSGNTGSVTIGTRKEGSSIGLNSLAQGDSVTASRSYSHAEGSNTQAVGSYSHAEGIGTQAAGSYSHAEGYLTHPIGSYSHAEGYLTQTRNPYEHSEGMFNKSHHRPSSEIGDPGNTLHSIGFGLKAGQEKNAVETMQDGKTYIYGIGGYDGTNPTGSGVKDVATAMETIQFEEWFPGGEAKSIEDCTADLKYDWDNANEANHTVEVLPFCGTEDSTKDNSDKSGRVVIPPYVDHEGTRYTVTGVAHGSMNDTNSKLTAIVAPTTVTNIGDGAFSSCSALTSILLPSAKTIAFAAFVSCTSLTYVSLPTVTSIEDSAFSDCPQLTSVDFGPDARQSVPTLGTGAFSDLSQSGHTCKIIVPDANYDAWTTDPDWVALTSMGYEFLRHSEWEYAHRYETRLTPVYSVTPTFSDWTISPQADISLELAADGNIGWIAYAPEWEDYTLVEAPEDATELSFTGWDDIAYTATRVRTDIIGYQLGSQEDKPLQPKGDYALVADATLTERGPNHDGFSEWSYSFMPDAFPQEYTVSLVFVRGDAQDQIPTRWELQVNGHVIGILEGNGLEEELEFTDIRVDQFDGTVIAARTALPGYILGSQTEKPIPKLSDIPAVVSPSTDAADAGKAADAKETGDALSAKANSAALAAPFSTSTAYPANSYVTHEGLMYKCASAVSAGDWDATEWTQVDLMTPDATFDVMADGRLRLSDSSGNELWSQGYGLASASATTLSCDKVNYYAFAATNYAAFSTESTYAVDAVVTHDGKVYTCTTAVDTAGAWTGSTNWTETPVSQEFTLPRAGSGKVGDFILDVSNENNAGHEVNISLSGTLGTDYDIIVPIGESISSILVVPGGGLAEFYFTMTAFGTAAKPAWKVVRQLVEREEATVVP